jgi:hypothetical protein
VLEDILDEIGLIADDGDCTKYQMTKFDGLVLNPTGIIMQKNSRFYEALKFAATSSNDSKQIVVQPHMIFISRSHILLLLGVQTVPTERETVSTNPPFAAHFNRLHR